MKKRREFCALVAGGFTAFSGCAAADDIANEAAERGRTETSTENLSMDDLVGEFPDPKVVKLLAPDNQLVSIDQLSQNTFTVTIQNTGHGGNIAIALFWQMKENATEPEGVTGLREGFKRERKQQLYFNSGERRTVEMTASPPDDALGFLFVTQPATHGAKITNHGKEGQVVARFTYATALLKTEKTKKKTVNIGKDETVTVLFDGAVAPNTK